MDIKKNIILALIFSTFISFVGFGMMFILWILIPVDSDLPGLFSYKAATIGDAFCLPLCIEWFWNLGKEEKWLIKKYIPRLQNKNKLIN